MVDLDTIEREIHDLEARGDTTYSLCERLAWLYVVRDHLRQPTQEPTQALSGSEFLEASSGVPYPLLMRVIDEHVQAIRAVYPRAYDELIARIRSLR